MSRTLAQPTTPNKVFFAILDEAHGTLARVDGAIVFMDDATGALTVIEPAHIPFLAVLGEVGLAQAQRAQDARHGGAARIACTRQQEVA